MLNTPIPYETSLFTIYDNYNSTNITKNTLFLTFYYEILYLF